MEPKILYEDDNLLVIDKPADLQVHPDGRSQDPTLVDWLLKKHPEIVGVGEPMVLENGEKIDRPGIVHRLDRDTSGVMVVAKNQETFSWLKQEFQSHHVEKTYRAIVAGRLPEPGGGVGRIEAPIGRSSRDPRLRVAHKLAKGHQRSAVTEYRVLRTSDRWTYVEAYPKTGRTHQLRAHFKYLNHPIVGDLLYAPKHEAPAGLARQALHAYKIAFNKPNGDRLEITAPLPPDFAQALEKAGIA